MNEFPNYKLTSAQPTVLYPGVAVNPLPEDGGATTLPLFPDTSVPDYCPEGCTPPTTTPPTTTAPTSPTLDSLSIGMAYTPIQKWQNIYEDEVGFNRGTIFSQLDLPFLGEEVM